MGLDGSQACINFCFGYSVFLEAHLQVIINSLECWQNIQTCRQASDDTTLGKSSGSRPDSEQGGRERSMLETEPGKVASPCPCAPSTKGKAKAVSEPLTPQLNPRSGPPLQILDLGSLLLGYLLLLPRWQKAKSRRERASREGANGPWVQSHLDNPILVLLADG